MSDDEKTGFAAIDEKAKSADPSPADVSEANTQAKNEHTETKDDTLGLTAPNVPENLQTTSAHRNDEANANTIGEVKAAHDGALQEIRDQVAEFIKRVEDGFKSLHARVDGVENTVLSAPAANDEDAPAVSVGMMGRLEAIERAVGIRVTEPEPIAEPPVQSQAAAHAHNQGLV